MKKEELQRITTSDLLFAYADSARAYGNALSKGNHKIANEQHENLNAIYGEIKRRGTEVQHLLLGLLNNENIAIRTCAATNALEFSPLIGERTLEDVGRSDTLFSLIARIILKEWRDGKLSFPSS